MKSNTLRKDPLTYPSRRCQNSQVRIYEKQINTTAQREFIANE